MFNVDVFFPLVAIVGVEGAFLFHAGRKLCVIAEPRVIMRRELAARSRHQRVAETEGRVEVRDTEEIKETGGDETGPEGQQQHQPNHLLMSTMIQYIIYKGVITM